MDYDVLVVGAGGMGAAIAAALAERGQRVLAVERFRVGHDRGSSHGSSRIVRQAYFESPRYIPLLRRAYQLWDALPPALRIQRVGCLTLGRQNSPVVSGAVASAGQWGIALEQLSGAEVARRYPQFRLVEGEVGLFEPNAGFVRPEQTVQWYVQTAHRLGAEVLENTQVTGWEVDDRGVRLAAGDLGWRGRKLVLAAGAWSGELAAALTLPIRVERRVMYFFRPRTHADRFLLKAMPTYLWDLRPSTDFEEDAIYGFPDEGLGAKIGFHHRGPVTDPDSVQPPASAAEVAEMRRVLAARLPDLDGELVRSVGCKYALTPDAHFLLGPAPGFEERVVVAAGFSGHGFKFVPVDRGGGRRFRL